MEVTITKDGSVNGVCNNPFSKFEGKTCCCAVCNPEGYCLEDPCESCVHPVTLCVMPLEEEL